MRYTVIWHPAARDELALAWTQAPNRQAVTDAADRIDSVLRVDPEAKGVDFYGDRLFVEPPLAVTFTVYAADRIVQILQVWSR